MARAGLDTDGVVAAAARLADAEGLGAVTLTRLARELGVRPPSLYAHVDGLADLRRRLGERGARELAQALGDAAAGRAADDALRAAAHAYLAYGRTHPGSYAASQLARDLKDDEAAQAAVRAAADVVFTILSRGYGLDEQDTVHAARAVRAALHGFLSLEAQSGFAIDLSLEDSFERMIAIFDAGLHATALAGGGAAAAERLSLSS